MSCQRGSAAVRTGLRTQRCPLACRAASRALDRELDRARGVMRDTADVDLGRLVRARVGEGARSGWRDRCGGSD